MEAKWVKDAEDLLVGKTIEQVRFLTPGEAKAFGFTKRPIAILFSDGNVIFPVMDPEGNNGAVLFTQSELLPVIPAM